LQTFNNPIEIVDVDGLKRTVQVVSFVGSNGELIEFTNNTMNVSIANNGIVDSNNSTNTPLVIDEPFIGMATEINDYGIIYITTKSDVASATNGLSIQQSSDGTNWDHTDEYTINANSGKTFSVQAGASYFRIVYTNGSIAQSFFRLQVILKKGNGKPSSHRVQDDIANDDDAELVKAVLSAKFNGSNILGNIAATKSGNLKTTDAESGLAIAKGDVIGTTFVHKFGNAKDFDTVDGEVTIWDGAEDGTAWELMNYVYSTTADIDSISSSNALDTQIISIQGLDPNWDLVNQTITLNGQTRVALTTPLIRIFRAFNDNSTDLSGHVVVYVNTSLTAGVPTDKTKIRAIIDPTNQQTLMAIYTIPNGKTGYMRDWYMATSGGNKASNYVVRLVSRNEGKVFRTKHISSLSALSPIPYQHQYTEPEVFMGRTDIEMRVESIASPNALENSISAGFDIVLIDN